MQAPPKGETKPVTFQKLLLNMCQDQFESTFGARKVAPSAYMCTITTEFRIICYGVRPCLRAEHIAQISRDFESSSLNLLFKIPCLQTGWVAGVCV